MFSSKLSEDCTSRESYKKPRMTVWCLPVSCSSSSGNASIPPLRLSLWHTRFHRYIHIQGKKVGSLTQSTFLSIITLGASSIRSRFFFLKNSKANLIQIPGGCPLFVLSWQQRTDYFHQSMIPRDFTASSSIRQSLCLSPLVSGTALDSLFQNHEIRYINI